MQCIWHNVILSVVMLPAAIHYVVFPWPIQWWYSGWERFEAKEQLGIGAWDFRFFSHLSTPMLPRTTPPPNIYYGIFLISICVFEACCNYNIGTTERERRTVSYRMRRAYCGIPMSWGRILWSFWNTLDPRKSLILLGGLIPDSVSPTASESSRKFCARPSAAQQLLVIALLFAHELRVWEVSTWRE